jgi:hypothetical protein
MEKAVLLLDEYRRQHPQCSPDTLLVLFLHNHYSHGCDDGGQGPELLRLCRQHSIAIYYLPPHLSHLVQPNDRGLHAHTKALYNVVLKKVLRRDQEQGKRNWWTKIGKQTFNEAVATVAAIMGEEDRSREIISQGFRLAGLSPLPDRPGFYPPQFPDHEEDLAPRDYERGADDAGAVAEPDVTSSDDEDIEVPPAAHDTPVVEAATPERIFITDEKQLEQSYRVVTKELRREYVHLQKRMREIADTLERVQEQHSEKRRAIRENIPVSPIRITEADHPANLHIDIMATPQMAIDKARRLSQIEVAPKAKKRRKSTLRVAGTISVEESDAFLTVEHNEAAAKELESRRKRLQRYLKWPSFRLFCRDREIDIDDASEEVLLAAEQSFKEAIRDKEWKAELEKRIADDPHLQAQLRTDLDDKLRKAVNRSQFKMYVLNQRGVLPRDLDQESLKELLVTFETLDRAAKAQLTTEWRTSGARETDLAPQAIGFENPEMEV